MDLFVHVSLFNLFSVHINYFYNKTAGKDDITVHYTKIKLKCVLKSPWTHIFQNFILVPKFFFLLIFHPESIFNTFKAMTLTIKVTFT